MEVPSTAASVRDLVHRRIGHEVDTWNLALVQRAEVWDQVRMRHLLDSLLAGYPIGAILLCRVRERSSVIRTDGGGTRTVETADPAAWQLLDGQQRINALTSVLTTHGRYGHFYLHMTRDRQTSGPTRRRQATDTALRHITWSDDPEAEIPDREFHVDLSRWADWADVALGSARTIHPAEVVDLLTDLDPGFRAELSQREADIAAARLAALADAWFCERIPVLSAEVETPLDVLEVFTRINLGGVQVVSTDVYFAAIKTFWTDAEASLARLDAATPFLRRRYDSLRFVSRLASRGLGHGDALPLDVERLTGLLGAQLRGAMQEMSAGNSRVIERIRAFSTWMTRNSELGFVLNLVTPELWDEVLAWAIASPRDDHAWLQENLPALDAYLLGATLFRYRQVIRERFQRIALLEALAAGADGAPFPLERILAVTRAGDGLRRRRQQIRSLATDRDQIATDNARALTCLAQRIDFQGDDLVDWDHIFPSAQANRMWRRGDGRRRHHPDRRLVNTAGNLWALLASTNRSLQDQPPRKKFEQLKGWQSDRTRVWPRDRWSLTDSEIADFIRVDDLLDDDPQHIEHAMEIFARLVNTRTGRLLDEALTRFPNVRLFASDSALDPDDASPTRAFHDELGLRTGPPAAAPPAGSDTLRALWSDREDELDTAVKQAMKIHDPEHRSPYRTGYAGFDRAAYVMVPPDPGTLAWVLVGRSMGRVATSTTPLWVRLPADSPAFDTFLDRVRRSDLAPSLLIEPGGSTNGRPDAWIPLVIPAGPRGDDLVPVILGALQRVVDVLAGEGTR